MAAPATNNTAVSIVANVDTPAGAFIRSPRRAAETWPAPPTRRSRAAQRSTPLRNRACRLSVCRRSQAAAWHSHTDSRIRALGPAPLALESCARLRIPWPNPALFARSRSTRRGQGSCKNLQQQALVATLDRANPLAFIDQVENVDGQRAGRLVEADPQRSGGGGDDTGQYRQPVGLAKVERDVNEPRFAFAPRDAKHDQGNGNIGADDVRCDKARQAEDGGQPPQPHSRRLQRCKQPASEKCSRTTEEEMPRRERLVEQQPEHEKAGGQEREGEHPLHVPVALRPG